MSSSLRDDPFTVTGLLLVLSIDLVRNRLGVKTTFEDSTSREHHLKARSLAHIFPTN